MGRHDRAVVLDRLPRRGLSQEREQDREIIRTPAPRRGAPGGSKSILFGLANLGGGSVWAVGRSEANPALIEHWNGSAWTIIPAPLPTVPSGNTSVGTTLNGSRRDPETPKRPYVGVWGLGPQASMRNAPARRRRRRAERAEMERTTGFEPATLTLAR